MQNNALKVQELKERIFAVQFLHNFHKQSICFHREQSLQRNQEISNLKRLIESARNEKHSQKDRLIAKNQRIEELLFHVKAQIAQSKSEIESAKDMVKSVKQSILTKEQRMKQLLKCNIYELTRGSQYHDNH